MFLKTRNTEFDDIKIYGKNGGQLEMQDKFSVTWFINKRK